MFFFLFLFFFCNLKCAMYGAKGKSFQQVQQRGKKGEIINNNHVPRLLLVIWFSLISSNDLSLNILIKETKLISLDYAWLNRINGRVAIDHRWLGKKGTKTSYILPSVHQEPGLWKRLAPTWGTFVRKLSLWAGKAPYRTAVAVTRICLSHSVFTCKE